MAVGNWSQLETIAAQAQTHVGRINSMCYDMDDTRTYAWHNAALLQNGAGPQNCRVVRLMLNSLAFIRVHSESAK